MPMQPYSVALWRKVEFFVQLWGIVVKPDRVS